MGELTAGTTERKASTVSSSSGRLEAEVIELRQKLADSEKKAQKEIKALNKEVY